MYPAFLLVPSTGAKLTLLAPVSGVGGIVRAAVPALLGFQAQGLGLAATTWILLLAPLALVAGLPSGRRRRRSHAA